MKRADAGSRLAVALDGMNGPRALALVDALGDAATLYKVGPALFLGEGGRIVAELRGRGKDVFLDLKLHDIPQSVASAVAGAAEMGISLLTLHASGGRAMLRAARAAIASEGGPRLLAVTVLTSLDAGLLAEMWGEAAADPGAQALRLARIARDEGIDGVVCSAQEVGSLRDALGPDALLVTPGIRPAATEGADDQRRVLGAAAAIRRGADILVVGRPIVRAASPAAAFGALCREIDEALA